MNSIIKIAAGMLILFAFNSCVKDKTPHPGYGQINLKWNQAHEVDSLSNAILGLEWLFSYIGSENSQAVYTLPVNNNVLSLDIRKLGFSAVTESNLEKLNEQLIESEEYDVNDAVDMGRYANLLIGAANHYYAFVEMPMTMQELMPDVNLSQDSAYVNASDVSHQHRKVWFSQVEGLYSQFWLSAEVDSVSGEVLEFETMDFLPNGQPRFGLFDKNGFRKNSADAAITEAGKPAKCMWCHESQIQPLFSVQSDYPNYLSAQELSDTLLYYRLSLGDYQETLSNGVDYSKKQDHNYAELLYLTFLEPSLSRLSLEWNIPENVLAQTLAGIPTHVNSEFPELGDVYFREDIKQYSPFVGLEVSTNARETSSIEVNHLD